MVEHQEALHARPLNQELAVGCQGVDRGDATDADGFTSIFNGKDLTGWTIQGTEKWYVAGDGNLVCESGPEKKYGYLATEASYDDFDLTLEFRQGADGNSGVFFRTLFKDVTDIRQGWQAEVAPPGSNTGGIYESHGRGWIVKPGAEEQKALRYGEWNSMRVRVDGGHVTTWLNGMQMIDLNDETLAKALPGSIALQIHSGDNVKVEWRNLRVKRL